MQIQNTKNIQKLFAWARSHKRAERASAVRMRGFTLVELIVTISMFTIISITILANYRGFQEALALKRTAQKIALSIRQAQAYGTSIKEFHGVFPSGYGVHFDISTPKSFILFADVNDSESYDVNDGCGGVTTECVEQFTIQTHEIISDICVNRKIGAEDCTLNTVDVIYKRPTPTVKIKNGLFSFSDAEIDIQDLEGGTKTIVAWLTGQISVE